MKLTTKKTLFFASLLGAMLACSLPTMAQTTANGYIIYYDGHFLSHAAGGALQAGGTTTFDLTTCLWTISGSTIRPVDGGGSTVLGSLYLRPRSGNTTYTLNTNTSTNYNEWTSGLADGGNPTYNTNRFLRWSGSNSTFQMSTTNSANAIMYAVSKTVTNNNVPESYNGSISGTEAFFTAGSTATYTPSATHTVAYSYTKTTYSYSGGELTSTTTGTIPTPTNANLASGWTLVWSLSDDTYATINNSGTLTVKSTLPTLFAITNVTLTATKNDGTGSFTASMPVTIYASPDVRDNVIGGNQGVSGGVVTLNDFEDHNWSYYSDASLPAELRSLYPANVKITYYGNGNNTVTTSTAVTPAANTFTASTDNAVAVGIGEPESTFVYYKTLERTSGTTYGSATYGYTTIHNPFSIRPVYGSGNSRWRGFYAWRIKGVSGGTISGKSVGDTIHAESKVSFIPTAEYGMAVELEALWAAAQVITSGSTFSSGYNSVERNFYVGRSGNSSVFATSVPCTYSSIYPNGTIANGNAATLNNRNNIQSGTASADSRVEYYIWSNTTALNTGGYKVDICRGVTSSGNGPSLTPLSGTHNTDKNARLRIETGSYNGGESSLYGTPNVGGNLVHLDLIFGSDYDRAKNDNTQLTFANGNTIVHGAHTATGARWLSFQHLDIIVKSGRMQPGYFTDASASYNRTFYCRSTFDDNQADRYPGITYLTVEGGEFASINGGRGSKVAGRAVEDDIVFSLRIKGGTIHGSIYGAASANPSFGGRRIVMTDGMVEGWIAGGCDGTTSGGGATLGNAYFYIGGNAKVGNTNNPSRRLDDTDGGNIFGAGRGRSDQGNSANPASMKNAYIALADNGFVLRSIYGGGDYGYTGVVTFDGQTSDETSVNIFVLGGTVNESVFGGGNNNRSACTNANITMTGGLVKNGIYGGSNNSGTMDYNVNINVNGGTVGDGGSGDGVFGGGYGQPTIVNGNVDITVGELNTTGATINGDVYGGSALGSVNGTAANTAKHTNVTLNAGTINGSLYGGALGDNSTAANVYGPVAVTVNGGTVNKTSADGSGAIYGCNNINGAPQRAVAVVINGTDAPASGFALDAVYGGGNRANYTYGTPTVTVNNCDNSIEYIYGGGNAASVPATDVTIYGGNTIGNVFGGGNGTVSAANVTGNTLTKIYGGTIGKVFGGSNSQGTIGGTIKVRVDKQSSCPMKIGELYGGGNMAASNVGSIDIGCTGDLTAAHDACNETDNRIGYELEGIGDVYGGANAATVTGNVELTIDSGMVYRVFGNNNTSASVSGTITVNIDKKSDACGWYVGYVYGGGNQAPYGTANQNYPAVNVKNGKVSYHVFGGGLGNTATVTGNPQVTLSGTAEVGGNVYGGGNAAPVVGNTKVTLKN